MAYCAYHKGTFSDIEQCPFCEQERIKRAKPGTTPSIEELISKWSNELVYSLDEAEIDLIEKIAPLILRDIAVAERNRWLKTCASRAEAEAFAATQRAPVEQGRGPNFGIESSAEDKAEIYAHNRKPELLPCPFCGSTDLKLTNLTEVDDFYVSCNKCEVQQIANYTEGKAVQHWNLRAPDHAREGALHDRVVAMRNALKPYLHESLRPEQILAIDVAIQAELERAAALPSGDAQEMGREWLSFE